LQAIYRLLCREPLGALEDLEALEGLEDLADLAASEEGDLPLLHQLFLQEEILQQQTQMTDSWEAFPNHSMVTGN
jgi:hypothetical protein